MNADRDFPRLAPQNHRITSPAAIEYNCVAWAAGDTENWWQPGVHWPVEPPQQEDGISALEDAFKSLGFEPCNDDGPEAGFEKVALYGNNLLDMHAARQLPGVRWTNDTRLLLSAASVTRTPRQGVSGPIPP